MPFLKDYKKVRADNHPKAVLYGGRGYVKEHIIIAEKALGRYLKAGEIVHHLDGNHLNNTNNNLVITDKFTHSEYHRRLDAFKACGNANYDKCMHCQQYDKRENLKYNSRGSSYHKECLNKYMKAYKAKRRASL